MDHFIIMAGNVMSIGLGIFIGYVVADLAIDKFEDFVNEKIGD